MTPFLQGFASELTKEAVVGKALGKGALRVLKKHPIMSLMGASVLASTGMAAREGYKRGLHGGERGQYLRASRRGGPSRAAYTDYHRLFKHKPSAKQVRRLSKHYKPGAFASHQSTPRPGIRPKKK